MKHKVNYSTVFDSMLAMFMLSSMEGNVDMMMEAMNFNGAGKAPCYNQNEHIQIFFVVFFFLGKMIILNCFIGLTLYNFKKIKERETGEKGLTRLEKLWLKMKVQILQLEPSPKEKAPANWLRRKFYRFCMGRCYKVIRIVLFVGYLVFCSFYTSNLSRE